MGHWPIYFSQSAAKMAKRTVIKNPWRGFGDGWISQHSNLADDYRYQPNLRQRGSPWKML